MKIIHGTFRDDRHGNELPTAITEKPKWPKPPKHLNEREKALWKELRKHAEAWTAPSDWLAVHGVVSLFDRLRKNVETQELTKAGPVIINTIISEMPGGGVQKRIEVKESPLISQEIKLWKELRAYIGLMGLSPVDRARVHKGDGESEKPPSVLGDLIRRGRTK